ncbi:hypothetical protein V7S43_001942 [Phytophthora oleae]|uniref:Uncharacterized protein n=1 Tax=Phytophthora oleae TaxID=2107226 RepID=A0ABD3G0G3_9STRA
MAGKAGGHHPASSGKHGGSAHHGSSHSSAKQDSSKGGASKDSSSQAGMPKWALDNHAKQLNPNNFRYQGGKNETK